MTVPAAAIHEQLRAEAATDDLQPIWHRVARQRATLLLAFETIDRAAADWRPPGAMGEATWNAREIALHVLAYSRNVLTIIEATAQGETAPKDPPGTLAGEAPRSFAQLRAVLARTSGRLLSVPARLPPDADTSATVPHALFGPLNWREWFLFLAYHDADHERQLAALQEMPGFPRT